MANSVPASLARLCVLSDPIRQQAADGEFKQFPTINPATGDVICQVQEGDKADVDAAVAAAKAALPAWQKVSGAERGKVLWKLADIMESKLEFLSDLEALDNGLKKALANGFVSMAISCLRYYAGWADKVHGKVMMGALLQETLDWQLADSCLSLFLRKTNPDTS